MEKSIHCKHANNYEKQLSNSPVSVSFECFAGGGVEHSGTEEDCKEELSEYRVGRDNRGNLHSISMALVWLA